MNEKTGDRIATNLTYTNSWWAAASALSRFFSYTEKFHAFTALKLAPAPCGRCLDTGFGFGYLLEKLARVGQGRAYCYGLDISRTNVTRFNRRVARQKLSNLAAMPLSPYSSQLPFSSDSIDTVYCSHVLEHVPDDTDLLREIRRILKPGGIAVIMVPINEEKLDVPTHLRKYTCAGFSAMLAPDFSILQQGCNDVFSHWIRCLALTKNPLHNIMKKLLIALLCITPFRLVERIDGFLIARGQKPSQTYLSVRKKQPGTA
jgi:ubiquinone/menaquinone biosynthesis C-methylase UbiE